QKPLSAQAHGVPRFGSLLYPDVELSKLRSPIANSGHQPIGNATLPVSLGAAIRIRFESILDGVMPRTTTAWSNRKIPFRPAESVVSDDGSIRVASPIVSAIVVVATAIVWAGTKTPPAILRGDRTHRSHKCANRQKNQRYRSHLNRPGSQSTNI